MSKSPRQEVAQALAPLVASAMHSESAMARLIFALELLTQELRDRRKGMITEQVCTCVGCGKRFQIAATVAQVRAEGLPENCPPCYLKRTGILSDWHKSFRYITG